MEIPIHSFPADKGDLQLTLGLAIAGFIVFVVGVAWLFRSKFSYENRNYKLLLSMLLGFGSLIALGTALFTGWAIFKTGDVNIYSNALSIGNQTIAFDQIRDARMEDIRRTSFVNPGITSSATQILLIETTDGKGYALSEKNYDIRAVLDKLRQAIIQKDSNSND